MPKIKTHSGASKRFKMTKTGKIKRAHVGRRHILNKKSNVAQVKRLLPYK